MKADRYFAAAYFQRGVHQLAKKAPGKAVQDFNYSVDVRAPRRGRVDAAPVPLLYRPPRR